MIAPLGRGTFLLITLGILCSGPVAACVCAEEPAPAMPCCPDDPQSLDHSKHGQPNSVIDTACDPMSADLLSAGSQDLPPPIGISSATQPPWSTHGPPSPRILALQQPYDSPPIYLVTLRLRN